ncbi:Peptidyl-prolyl cis-trans isomerase cyp15 [Cystobasidiomycetes sp. EMM_F5]
MPLPLNTGNGSNGGKAASEAAVAVKKRRILKHEQVYLDNLPSAERYYRSFMHRDVLTGVAVTKHVQSSTDFVLTASADGWLKFWKKRDPSSSEQADVLGGVGIEFVKQFRAHLSPILALPVSADGAIAATISADGSGNQSALGSIKVYDVENFDMINQISLSYTPTTACWVHPKTQARALLAVAEESSHVIRIYDGSGDGQPLMTVSNVHRKGSQVTIIAYNDAYDTIVSADDKGMVEYWSPREPFELAEVPGMWKYKSDTDLYEFKKTKSLPNSITISPSGSHFVTTSLLTDRHIRIFSFLTGKLYRKYDETLTAIQELQQAGTASSAPSTDTNGALSMKLDEMEFGRRLAIEKELAERSPESARRETAAWDETGNFILYPSLVGIKGTTRIACSLAPSQLLTYPLSKVINTITNRLVRILGRDENHRFLNISLYQGAPIKKGLQTIAMAASENPLLNQAKTRDPTLFCTAFKRSRFYMFSQIEPESDSKAERDVFNEKPTREEATIASVSTSSANKPQRLARQATLHTTKGDIHFDLLPDVAPKAVENFVGHARSTYYEGIIFHRVIKKFMLQTGDPLGDGTGGESIWGKSFEDEISANVKHDRPYTLSMANAGPKTNGSQFFITTVPCPWLDGKHTIFGRATSGYEVIHNIENARVDKMDKPYDDIKIVSVTIH